MSFRFEKLTIWKMAMDFGEEIHKLAYRLPKEELYNLSSQIRRASDSIAFEYIRRFNWSIRSRI
jgi:four helix bundle protein